MTAAGAHRPPPRHPDYELDETLEVSDAAGLKAVADTLRGRILSLLLERAATTSELAEALDRPKGTVGYHVKVLEDAGLIRVVRTEQVRAVTAKYYGRVARTFVFTAPHAHGVDPFFMIHEAMGEAVTSPLNMTTLRHARIPRERVEEWRRRLGALVREFADEEPAGDEVYGLLVGLHLTKWRALPDKENP